MDDLPRIDKTVEERLQRHIAATEFDMAAYASLCRLLDEAYKPSKRMADTGAWDVNTDQPKPRQARVSVPLIWTAVNIKSNILGMRPPKLNVRPLDRKDPIKRASAEGVEVLIDKMWDDENMDLVWMDNARCLSLYGRSVFQEGEDDAGEPFTLNLDQQYNLWISWRRLNEPEAMSFQEMVSEREAMDMGWDGLTMDANLRFNFPIYGGYTHSDPLGVKSRNWRSERDIYGKIPVVHFYYKKTKRGNVHYALIVNGSVVKRDKDLKRKSWPFKVIEAEHVPGYAHGVGDAEPLLDIQAEYSIRKTEWAESIRRNIKDQWKAWGLKHLTPRMLPGEGRVWELTDKETDDIEPLKYPTDDVAGQAYLAQTLSDYRRTSGIPAEAEADGSVSAPTSAVAMNMKFQALITQLAPRQKRLLRFAREWAISKLEQIAKKYPEYKDLVDPAEFILDVSQEQITPKDVAQVIQNLSTAVAGKLESPYSAMEELGLVPEDEMELMAEFWTDPRLNPQGAMAQAQAMMMLQQVQQMSAQQPGAGFTGGQLEQRAREEAMSQLPQGTEENNQFQPTPGMALSTQIQGPAPMGAV